MSSETPSFKLWPVNSTLVYSYLSQCDFSLMISSPYLLHIDAGGAFENLLGSSIAIVTKNVFSKYLNNGSVT